MMARFARNEQVKLAMRSVRNSHELAAPGRPWPAVGGFPVVRTAPVGDRDQPTRVSRVTGAPSPAYR
ncbi:hypothetical protein SAMN05421812_10541 [Asanoa hainanensis]|uniref:Uncharacterized protein n=1 Tax=Asanoa hainanensis TaxID=560556 RepID=A0A239M1G8_9ACTN|nr:hypothetical protein SAMN05421812_10541 [Asanoa hainanensis]